MDPLTCLRQEFGKRGFYRKATGRILFELAIHLVVTGAGLAVLVTTDHFLLTAGGILLCVLGSAGVANNTHTSSHYATSSKRWVNELLTYFGYPFFWQLSATYWQYKHVVLHHRHPNTVGIDTDISLLPWFALTREEVSKSSGWFRAYYRLQWVFLPLALSCNLFNLQIAGWRYLMTRLTSRQWNAIHTIDLGALTGHWVAWVILPSLVFTWTDVLAFYLTRNVLMGYMMFAVFAPAHFPSGAAMLDGSQISSDFMWRQTLTTVNFRTGWLGRLLCSGLEYQIEHHLFPGISHVHYPEMSLRVRDVCEKHGYPYRTLGWAEAIWESCAVFRTLKEFSPPREALGVLHQS